MKKIAAVAATLILALCLTGCSETKVTSLSEAAKENPEQTEKGATSSEPLTLEYGFTGHKLDLPAGSEEQWVIPVGIVIENPNPGLAYNNVAIVLTVKDAEGNVIATDPEFKIGDLAASERFGLGITMYSNAEPATVSVSLLDSGTTEGAASTMLSVDNFNTIPDSDILGARVLGEVTNSGEPINTVTVGAVFRNAEGAIVGGGFTDVSNLEGTLPFEIYTDYMGSSISNTEVFAHHYR